MKANEFIKKHGLQYTKSIIGQFPKHTHVTNDGRMFIDENTCCNHIEYQLDKLVKMDDLKRLVESHGVIEACGGIHMARADVMDLDGFEKTSPHWMKIKQAILDVESCQ